MRVDAREEELTMPEINETADAVHGSEDSDLAPVPDGPVSLPGDDFDLELIERLAEEQDVQTDIDSPVRGTAREPALDGCQETAAIVDATQVLGSVEKLAEQLGRRLDLLQTTFERELRAEKTRERVVDRLHAELQDYKQDFLLKVQRPIFIDLIQLHDDIGKMVDSGTSTDADPDAGVRLHGTLESIQAAIEDILYRQGVEPFTLDGTEFDPRKQRAVSTQATDDPALHKRVAARLRKGFCSGDKLIRPEIVTVFTHRPLASA
jgi:molecular chaperone GrpE